MSEITLIPDPITEIRCPICCAVFDGRHGTPEFEAFAAEHEVCKGQSFDCPCEWERLCDSTTLLCRVSDPCPRCVAEQLEDGCRKCPGCLECRPPKSPLALAVKAGAEDARLLHHLSELDRCMAPPSAGSSESEKRLRDLIWQRLEAITHPRR